MIQQQTILKVSDNSGAKTVKCIKVLGGFKRVFSGSAHCGMPIPTSRTRAVLPTLPVLSQYPSPTLATFQHHRFDLYTGDIVSPTAIYGGPISNTVTTTSLPSKSTLHSYCSEVTLTPSEIDSLIDLFNKLISNSKFYKW